MVLSDFMRVFLIWIVIVYFNEFHFFRISGTPARSLTDIDVKEVTSTMNNLYQEVAAALKTDNEKDSIADLQAEFKRIAGAFAAYKNSTSSDSKFGIENVKIMLASPEKYLYDLKNLAFELKCTRRTLPKFISTKFKLSRNSVYNLTKLYELILLKFYLKYFQENILYAKFQFNYKPSDAFERYEDLK